MGKLAEDQFGVVVKVVRVPGHQRDAPTRGDNSGSDEELVDAMQDARLAAADGRNHCDSLLEWETLVHGNPCLVAEIRWFDRGFRCQRVVAPDDDVQGLKQERFHTH